MKFEIGSDCQTRKDANFRYNQSKHQEPSKIGDRRTVPGGNIYGRISALNLSSKPANKAWESRRFRSRSNNDNSETPRNPNSATGSVSHEPSW